MTQRSPGFRLIAGLVVTVLAVAMYSGYTILQLRSLRQLQTDTIDRNRVDSLLLLRIQNGLNSLALTMRDMLETEGGDAQRYPLSAWRPQFRRVLDDIDDGLAREAPMSTQRDPDQRRYLTDSMRQFRESTERVLDLADQGNPAEARTQIRNSLQARQTALSADVARLLVANNRSQEETSAQTEEIYARVERNTVAFLAAMLVVVVATGMYVVQNVRRLFRRLEHVSEHRRDLARQLISSQESTFRSISRELHDEFGQILTAIGAILQRADRKATRDGTPPEADLREVRGIVQSTLEKVRSLSQALHPSVLDQGGLESALEAYLPGFENRTGIQVSFEKTGKAEVSAEASIQLYRVIQEALNNVARHSRSRSAWVRIGYSESSVTVEIEDEGIGYKQQTGHGLGLVSMRERAELLDGTIEFATGKAGGALVRVTIPGGARRG